MTDESGFGYCVTSEDLWGKWNPRRRWEIVFLNKKASVEISSGSRLVFVKHARDDYIVEEGKLNCRKAMILDSLISLCKIASNTVLKAALNIWKDVDVDLHEASEIK